MTVYQYGNVLKINMYVDDKEVKKLFSKEGTNSHLQTSLFISAMSLQWESGLDLFSLLIRGRKPFINHDFACRPLSKPSDETFMSSAEGGGKKLLRCLLYFFPKIELFLSASAGKWRDFLCICICICLCICIFFYVFVYVPLPTLVARASGEP